MVQTIRVRAFDGYGNSTPATASLFVSDDDEVAPMPFLSEPEPARGEATFQCRP
jgi:hypothetical protein